MIGVRLLFIFYSMDFNNQDQNRFEIKDKTPFFVKWGVVTLLLLIVFYQFGYSMGRKGFVLQPKEFKVVNQNDQAVNVDYQLLWDALEVVDSKYIDNPVDKQKILYGAIKGAVESTGDPYTTFFEPKDLQSFRTDLAGSFDGIGAEVGKKANNIVIIAPLEGSPAQKAGLKPQDIILEVNQEAISGWTVEQAVQKIRGKKGTPVTLTMYREGQEKPFEVTIVRDKIEVKSVKWEIKDVTKNNVTRRVAVITLSRFGDDTTALFTKAVNDVLTRGAQGIVLDVRNNPGGYLQTSVDLASYWLEQGKIVVSEARNKGVPEEYLADGNNRLAGIKTVVIINGGSASASEILAGALHDHKVATLIGEKSFGKGSVQELVDLSGGAAVKVTVAKWITPAGKNLNKEGLVPDIEVKISEEEAKAGTDTQMEKALEEIVK